MVGAAHRDSMGREKGWRSKEERVVHSMTQDPKVPAAVERFVKQLVVTNKAVVLYPAASSIPKENATHAVELLKAILQDVPEVRFSVLKDGLYHDGLMVFEGQPAFEYFAQELYHRNVSEVRFHSGMTAEDLIAFLGILQRAVDELCASGGIESCLWDAGVDAVTVREIVTRIVDAAAPVDMAELPPGESWPPERERIEEIIAAAIGGRPHDQRLLVRLVGDSAALTGYMRETLVGRGRDPHEVMREIKFAELARSAANSEPGQRDELQRSLASAILDLEPDLRRMLIAERLLPEARSDDSIAAVVRQMDIDEVSRMLVEGLAGDAASIEGLARAIRNLAAISMADRESVLHSAGAAMRSEGTTEEVIDAVFEAVAPSRLQVTGDVPESAETESAESILKLVNLASGSAAGRFDEEPDIMRLQEESRLGISDADVVGALVTIVSSDARHSNFASVMVLIEDSIGLLIDRGEFVAAADAAEALVGALDDPSVSEERRLRLENAMAALSRTAELTEVSKALRMFKSGTPEHTGCTRLLAALGSRAIGPLLEVLADEPDMTSRKTLVDLVSQTVGFRVDDLGERVSDGRWYFVRNVVAILGKTRNPEALPYLRRTMRHTDARVRRETIRALTGVQDRMASEMLIACLEDPDTQNVQLAARFLGSGQVRGAVPALEQVARGEGRGNREVGPRVEAIEALARLGSTQSVPLLEQLASKRTLIGASRTRELSAAAGRALRMIAAGPGPDRGVDA
jgi:hypothetical protein